MSDIDKEISELKEKHYLTDKDKIIEKQDERIADLEQAIMSNCYDDPSASGRRLIKLVYKGNSK